MGKTAWWLPEHDGTGSCPGSADAPGVLTKEVPWVNMGVPCHPSSYHPPTLMSLPVVRTGLLPDLLPFLLADLLAGCNWQVGEIRAWWSSWRALSGSRPVVATGFHQRANLTTQIVAILSQTTNKSG